MVADIPEQIGGQRGEGDQRQLKLEDELSFWEYFRYMTIPTWGYFIKQFLNDNLGTKLSIELGINSARNRWYSLV